VLQCVAVCCSVLQCVAVCCSVLQCVAVAYARHVKAPPKMQEIALRPSTNKSIVIFFVLVDRRSSFTEITEYPYFWLLKPSRELKYKGE